MRKIEMKKKFKFTDIFWNITQKRLCTFWRLALHTLGLVLLTMVLPAIIILLVAVVDRIAGTNLASGAVSSEPLQAVMSTWLGLVIVPFATLLAIVAVTYLVGRFMDKRHFKDFGLRFSRAWWLDLLFGLFLGALLMGVIFLFGWLTGQYTITGYFQSRTADVSFLMGFFQTLILFLCVGIYEELLSRGYHLINLAEGLNPKWLGSRWAVVIAWVISSVVFGVLHINNPNATWISTLNITLAGIFLGLGMVLTGKLAIPIGLHITWNFFQGAVFGFPVSGMPSGATVIATREIGADWLTGGRFGPEAGVLGLAAMILGSLLTLWWVQRRGKAAIMKELAEYEESSSKIKADPSATPQDGS
jgi:membrane protease YdiL (CAAX protease family)